MHQSQLLFWVAFFGANVAAVPLNINLGAYSPALVVGDGEISFGGKADVTGLMNALEGAAVSGAAAAGQAAPAAAAAQPAAAAAAPATSAAPAANAANIVPNEGTQITALQGMEKEKRDINGFNAALKYATDALKTSPKVQLGTGAEGSGVGILQDAGGAVSTGAKPAAAAAGKRNVEERAKPSVNTGAGHGGSGIGIIHAAADASSEKKLRTTVTTMFVKGGPAPAQVASDAQESTVIDKRAPSPGLDGVNLNMAEGQVAELTFVETRAVDDNEDEE